jgi:hypothetical protein
MQVLLDLDSTMCEVCHERCPREHLTSGRVEGPHLLSLRVALFTDLQVQPLHAFCWWASSAALNTAVNLKKCCMLLAERSHSSRPLYARKDHAIVRPAVVRLHHVTFALLVIVISNFLFWPSCIFSVPFCGKLL